MFFPVSVLIHGLHSVLSVGRVSLGLYDSLLSFPSGPGLRFQALCSTTRCGRPQQCTSVHFFFLFSFRYRISLRLSSLV